MLLVDDVVVPADFVTIVPCLSGLISARIA
jgi:hypothetical protein